MEDIEDSAAIKVIVSVGCCLHHTHLINGWSPALAIMPTAPWHAAGIISSNGSTHVASDSRPKRRRPACMHSGIVACLYYNAFSSSGTEH
jgi:hypothetical protein